MIADRETALNGFRKRTREFQQVLVYGAGGHAKVVADLARICMIDIAGFVDTNAGRVGEKFYGSVIFHDTGQIRRDHAGTKLGAVVAIGDCAVRARVATDLERQNLNYSR
jgi:hypothetical protein